MSAQILEGVKVLDCSCVVAAPMAASFLSDFGADVIRVELPGSGDGMRGSLYNRVLNRNKRSITLDFHKVEAVEQFYRLLTWADVVVMNFRPQTLRRFRIDYEDCIRHNPAVIYLSFSAYGRTGPRAHEPGFARVAEAYAGLTYITGWPDRPPSLSGSWIADGIGGIYSAYLILLALYHRERTGEGQLIDLGLYEPLFRILDDMPVGYSATGIVPERRGNLHRSAVPNNLYKTGDGQYLALPLNLSMFPRFCRAMGREDLLEDEHFSTGPARRVNRELVDDTVAALVASRTAAEMLELSERFQFPCGPANSIRDIFNERHMWERGSLVRVEDEAGRELVINGVCGVFSKTPGEFRCLAPELGSSNEEIYRGMLGLSEEEFDHLREIGAI